MAYQILQAGFQLDLPLMFAALFLITCTGLGLFVLMSLLSHFFLNKWHESEQV
ncbi:ABC-type nitrate/sulfonate/bicarbonate transport system, permease component domain protein [Acinetobacter sp. 1245249]|nr:ABC-type nitrate/sulfonate/bicarbonate transport system, permease component domain protein [Acinetobacter sp. 1245249]